MPHLVGRYCSSNTRAMPFRRARWSLAGIAGESAFEALWPGRVGSRQSAAGRVAVGISRFPVPGIEDLPDDVRARMRQVEEKAGFVPNVFRALAHRPDEFRAFFAYHDALMQRENGLTKGEKEMIVVATSALNGCLYCVVAHGAILRVYEKKPLIADQVAVNHRKADITPRQKAMLDFALKVTRASHEIGEPDFEALRAHGFDDE